MLVITLFWIVFVRYYALCESSYKGVDIGNSCQYDVECILGNGGEYSKCNRDLMICICTINHRGEDQCLPDSDENYGFCRRRELFESLKTCTLECSPKGTKIWTENEDWNGEIMQPFSQMIHDKKTSVCYDPRRALNTVSDGFEVKQSSIPDSGLGVFTNVYIEAYTVLSVFKGTFDPEVDDVSSIYSWTIRPQNGGDVYWTDGTNIAQSNWLRYMNTPITAAMENLIGIEFQERIYYLAFRAIQPRTELLIWYGGSYAQFLGLEPFDHPNYLINRMPGYAGGSCEREWKHCENDKNTICADGFCLCRNGTRQREMICVQDEELGGYCVGFNGDTCKQDKHAECQRGICVCKNYSVPTNGKCIPDETFGGRCKESNGQKCLFDNKTECANGVCKCIFGTSAVGGICKTDEAYNGICIGNDGDDCELDENAECMNNICVCKENAVPINGRCIKDVQQKTKV
ncbi:uncharacterized protein LOC132728676 [Ruditapes philippinarum]|uniref:uncharacterized protein LOC132728676 n=1 Tax=Ruditapes philippinarum TaxID=129788 RepID=UPI00295AADF1|nr:uncharacterized protein LOC132728676 [Ruditapes philippinarum]